MMGMTALALAVHKQHKLPFRTLLNSKADPNIINKDGIGPLYLTLKNKNYTMQEMLLDKGTLMYYDSKDLRDISPMFSAIKMGDLESIENFMQHGA